MAGFGFGLLIGGMFERMSYLVDMMSWPSGIGVSGGVGKGEEVVVSTRERVYTSTSVFVSFRRSWCMVLEVSVYPVDFFQTIHLKLPL